MKEGITTKTTIKSSMVYLNGIGYIKKFTDEHIGIMGHFDYYSGVAIKAMDVLTQKEFWVMYNDNSLPSGKGLITNTKLSLEKGIYQHHRFWAIYFFTNDSHKEAMEFSSKLVDIGEKNHTELSKETFEVMRSIFQAIKKGKMEYWKAEAERYWAARDKWNGEHIKPKATKAKAKKTIQTTDAPDLNLADFDLSDSE